MKTFSGLLMAATTACLTAAFVVSHGNCGEDSRDSVKIALQGRKLFIQGNRQPFPPEAFETPEKSWPRLAEFLKPVLGARDAEGRCPVVPAVSVDDEAPSEALITVLMAVAGHGCRACELSIAARGGVEQETVTLRFDMPATGKDQVMTLKIVGEAGREKLDLDGQQISASRLDPLAPPLKEAVRAKALIRIRPEGRTSAARTVELLKFCKRQGAERFELFEPARLTKKEKEDAREAKDAVDRALEGVKIGK